MKRAMTLLVLSALPLQAMACGPWPGIWAGNTDQFTG